MKKDFEKIMLVDCLMQNTDRHVYNYGIIVDAKTQNITGLAPMFDTGASCIDMECSFLDYTPTGESFDKTFKHLSDETKELLMSLSANNLQEIVSAIPSMSQQEKQKIINTMTNRLQTMQREYERKGYEIER